MRAYIRLVQQQQRSEHRAAGTMAMAVTRVRLEIDGPLVDRTALESAVGPANANAPSHSPFRCWFLVGERLRYWRARLYCKA